MYCSNLFDTGRAYSLISPHTTPEEIKKKSLLSLEKIIAHLLDVKIDKFFQLADWRIRPLPKPMLSYARTDSHYLVYLYSLLCQILNENVEDEREKEVKTPNRLVELAIECNNLLKKRFEKIKYKRVRLTVTVPPSDS